MVVTSGGLQLLELGPQGLKSTKASKEMQAAANEGLSNVLWCKYQHHCRLLLLGTQFELIALQITAQVRCCHAVQGGRASHVLQPVG